MAHWRHVHRPSVDSTNALLLRAAHNGENDGLWLTADEQTQGRGRRGRVWNSPVGNLHASLLLIDPAPTDAIGSFPLAMALAAHDSIQSCLSDQADVKIKWPNDILVGGAKICGLLAESAYLADGRRAIIAGFGANVAAAPPDTPYPATSLAASGGHADAQTLFLVLAQAVQTVLTKWDRGRNIETIRAQWLDHAAGIGQRVSVQVQGSTQVGVFETLDELGHMVLLRDDGTRSHISAGDVFFEELMTG